MVKTPNQTDEARLAKLEQERATLNQEIAKLKTKLRVRRFRSKH